MRKRTYLIGGVAIVGLAAVALSQRGPAPHPRQEATGKRIGRVAHSHPEPRRPTPARTRPPIQAPKVGSTSTTITHHGGATTATIIKSTVVGSTTTSTLAPPPATPGIPGQVGYRGGLTFSSTGDSPSVAFAALWRAHREPPPHLAAPIQTVAVPWANGTTWALVPVGLADPAQGGAVLWAGVSSQPHHWVWIPNEVAAAVNPALPFPVRQTLQWAADLALDAPGPANLLGQHSWASVTGQVQPPAGWSIQAVGQTLLIEAWDPSAHYTPLYFAPEGIWTQANATTGHQALGQIVAAAVPLPKAVAPPPISP